MFWPSTSNLTLYELIDLLHREAKIIEINTRLISETKLLRFQRKSTAHIQTKLVKLWLEYEAWKRSTEALFKFTLFANETDLQTFFLISRWYKWKLL